jgi:IS4 transposase
VREISVSLDTGKSLRVVSNDLDGPAEEIAALYKRRWAIELYFRWIEQTLKLRHFYGTSENAVRIQIAVALIAFVLIRLAHQAYHGAASLTRFARLVRATVFHRNPIQRLRLQPETGSATNQNRGQGCLQWT